MQIVFDGLVAQSLPALTRAIEIDDIDANLLRALGNNERIAGRRNTTNPFDNDCYSYKQKSRWREMKNARSILYNMLITCRKCLMHVDVAF